MPPQIQTAEAKPAAPDYKPYVGKVFRHKEPKGITRGVQYKIADFIPAHDFGVQDSKRVGLKPAFVLYRIPAPGRHTESCEHFLSEHEEVTVGE